MNILALRSEEASAAARAAKTALAHVPASSAPAAMGFPDHWPAQGELLTWTQQIGPGLAALMVLLGVVYLLFGFNIFKALVVLNAACLGAVIGSSIGDHTGGTIPLAITFAFVAAVITLPLMRWAVAITGGLCGVAIGVSLWRTCNLDPGFAWAGAAMGLIFFCLLTFILFRGCVMTYMSLQGAAMLVFGGLALIFKYDGMMTNVHRWFTVKPFVLPMTVFIATVLGVMFQQNNATPAAPAVKK